MGKKGGKRGWKKKKRKAEGGDDPSSKRDPERFIYEPRWQTNKRMEAYYAYQGIHHLRYDGTKFVPCTTDDEREDERNKWITSLRKPLQASFRLGQDIDVHILKSLEDEIQDMVGNEMELRIDKSLGNRSTRCSSGGRKQQGRNDVKKEEGDKETNKKEDDEEEKATTTTTETTTTTKQAPNDNIIFQKMAPAKKIPFVPNAYQLSVDRHTIRVNDALSKFHVWLQTQNAAGLLTRQETVSMIPPVVLDVQSHHTVLDMCAAPGSKTSQMLELVSKTKSSTENGGGLEPSGCVIANDADPKRSYMLVHQLKRINSPASLVTACDARFFPTSLKANDDEKKIPLTFDRVLADVPCSGDGTTRKNPGIWKRWWCIGSLGLHPLQIQIATRAAHLTKVGGKMCYSTCSMNPMENEAVVCELLRRSQGSLQLVDIRKEHPTLSLTRPGMTTWKVLKEAESKRNIRNKEKKNSEKMKKRRLEYQLKMQNEEEEDKKNSSMPENGNEQEEKDKKLSATTSMKEETKIVDKEDGDGTVDGADAMDTSQNGDVSTITTTTATTTDQTTNNKSVENEEKSKTDVTTTNQDDDDVEQQEFGPPPSWDEATLKARVESVDLKEYATYDDVPQDGLHRKRLRPSVFPPSSEEVESFGLEKCLRCMPHDMDTGGFFVAVFEKLKDMPGSQKKRKEMEKGGDDVTTEEEKKEVAAENGDDDDALEAEEETTPMQIDGGDGDDAEASVPAPGQKSHPLSRKGKEHEYYPSNGGLIKWEPLVEYYGLTNLPLDQLMVRSKSGTAKSIYFISKPVKDLLDAGLASRLMIINTGLKAFERNTNEGTVEYRVAQEGVHYILPYMNETRKISVDLEQFKACMQLDPFLISTTIHDDDLKERIRSLQTGCFVLVLEGYEKDYSKKMFMVMWRCRGDRLNCLVNKTELEGMKSKIRCIEKQQQQQQHDEKAKLSSASATAAVKGQAE